MKRVLLLIAVIFFTAVTFAQVSEVTLTVIGTGENEEKATLQALRSAIEQTFGTFVSANTTILNDKLVQDEIVSVSTGNVTNYSKLAVTTLPNGHTSVSLKATVSVNKLVSYARSKGSKAEFAGATYAANAKLIQLKVEAATKAYSIMVEQLEQIAKEMYDFQLNIYGQPQRRGDVYQLACSVDIYPNIASTDFYNLYYNTINELKLSRDEIRMCKNEEILTTTFCCYDNSDKYATRDVKNEPPIYVLPLPMHTYKRFQIRLANAIHSALNRYVIQEIGNPGVSIVRRTIIDENYTDEAIRRIMLGNRNIDLEINKFREKDMLSRFTIIKLVDVPLSKEERKKSSLLGKTHKTMYARGSVIVKQKLTLMIPAERMNSFQGFELTNVSPHTNHCSYTTLPKKYKNKTIHY